MLCAVCLSVLASAEVCAQDAIILDTIETVSASEEQTPMTASDDRQEHAIVIRMDEHATELSEQLQKVTSARIADNGNRLQKKSFAFRGAAAQDIAIRYHGVTLNALSDASADLALIPAQLIQDISIFGSGATSAMGAVGGLVELHPQDAPPLSAFLSVSSLRDYALFSQGSLSIGENRIQAAVWGDSSPGKFHYIDEQGSHQIREHNAASRIGTQISARGDLPLFEWSAFSLLSHIDREEAGLSEYPAKYRDATQQLWLSLSAIQAQSKPVALGISLARFNLSLSERLSNDVYDNPTAFIGGKKTHSDYLESRSSFDFNAAFLIGSWSQTAFDLAYECQYLTSEMLAFGHTQEQSHKRHILSASAREALTFFREKLQLAITGRTDWNVDESPLFSYHAGVTVTPVRSLSLWGSASMAERYPTFDEAYYRTEYMRGNADIRPQRSFIHELGVTYTPIPWFRASVSGFYNLHEDLIRFIPVTPYLYEAKNITGATARGIETGVAILDWHGLSAKAEYTFADVLTDDGFPMPTSPKHHVMGEIAYEHPWLRASFDIQYQSKVARNMAGTDFTPAKLRLNLHGGMQLYPDLWFSVDITNLLNDMASADVLQRPLPGRQAFVNLRYAYK